MITCYPNFYKIGETFLISFLTLAKSGLRRFKEISLDMSRDNCFHGQKYNKWIDGPNYFKENLKQQSMHHTQGPASPRMIGPLQQCQDLKPPSYSNNWAHETNRQIFKCSYNQLEYFLHLLIIIWGNRCCYPCNLSDARCNWKVH